jgi:GH24 family phage-related lysozyme (muramidase)
VDKPVVLHENYLAVKAKGILPALDLSGFDRLSVLDNGLRVAFNRGASSAQINVYQALLEEFQTSGTFFGFKVEVLGGVIQAETAIVQFLKGLCTFDINAEPAVHAGTIRDHFQSKNPGTYPVVPERLEKLPDTLPAFEPLKKTSKKKSGPKADATDKTGNEGENVPKHRSKKDKERTFTLTSEGVSRQFEGIHTVGYRCSDGMWRCLDGEELAAAQERTRRKEEMDAKKRKDAPDEDVDPKPARKRPTTKKQAASKKASPKQKAAQASPIQASAAKSTSGQSQLAPQPTPAMPYPVSAPVGNTNVPNQYATAEQGTRPAPTQFAQPAFNPHVAMQYPVPGRVSPPGHQQQSSNASYPAYVAQMERHMRMQMQMAAMNSSQGLQQQNQSYGAQGYFPGSSYQPMVQNQDQLGMNHIYMAGQYGQFNAAQQLCDPRFANQFNQLAAPQVAPMNNGMAQSPGSYTQSPNPVTAQA